MLRRPVLVIIAAAFAALGRSQAMGQDREPTHRVTNAPPQISGGFGTYCKGLADFDGDGYADYAVAGPNAPYPTAQGRVYLYSGRTSKLIRTFDGDQPSSDFGLSMADLGDIDGDGTRDLAIGARSYDPAAPLPNAGMVRAFSGATGSTIWTVLGTYPGGNLGETLGEIADVSGDGNLDLVAGEPGAPGGGTANGRLLFLSGSSGAALGDAPGLTVFGNLGRSLATRPESSLVIAGSTNGNVYTVGLPVAGMAAVTLLYPAPPGANLPARLDLVKAPGLGHRLLLGRVNADTGGLTNNGTVELFDIGAPAPVLAIAGTASSESVGLATTAVRDADGDGLEEIAFMSSGASIFTPFRVRVVTQSGTLIDDVLRGGGGGKLTSIPDVTGDGRGEWINSTSNGLSLVFESTLFSGGLAMTSTTSGPSGFVATFAISAGIQNAGRVYAQVYGFSGASPGFMGPTGWPLIPLNVDDTTLAILNLAGSSMFPDAVGLLSATGTASTTMNIPAAIAALVSGLTATTAGVAFDASGTIVVQASNPVLVAFP
jgi:hypothetical protein